MNLNVDVQTGGVEFFGGKEMRLLGLCVSGTSALAAAAAAAAAAA